ncbi:MAG: hypothetical protein U9N61_05580 [Euryarchaeota archaeon]|nr:hypothetical protein [Euryarchaeota archaeon]
MALNTFTKQSYEVFWISASFANDLGDSEAIVLASSTVTAIDANGDDVTSTVLVSGTISVSDQTLRIQVQAGSESLSPYKITFRITTNASPVNKWEHDVRMKIKEL